MAEAQDKLADADDKLREVGERDRFRHVCGLFWLRPTYVSGRCRAGAVGEFAVSKIELCGGRVSCHRLRGRIAQVGNTRAYHEQTLRTLESDRERAKYKLEVRFRHRHRATLPRGQRHPHTLAHPPHFGAHASHAADLSIGGGRVSFGRRLPCAVGCTGAGGDHTIDRRIAGESLSFDHDQSHYLHPHL
eukprot:COSAG01_NODE_2829_length_6998_cov_487.185824_8_plen_189_part_00